MYWQVFSSGLSFTLDRKSTRLNSSHVKISYAVFCLKKKNIYVIILATVGDVFLLMIVDLRDNLLDEAFFSMELKAAVSLSLSVIYFITLFAIYFLSQ